MKSIVLSIILGISVVVLSGCETTSSRPYTASTENILMFQGILLNTNAKLKLGAFTENKAISDLTCRLMGPVDVSPGKSKADYIKEAMQTELFMAQVYDVNGEVELTGNLNSIDFSSISPASWTIDFSISSNKHGGYKVTTNYPFKTSYSAYSACSNVADAFGPAVQQLIRDIINHSQFGELVGL